MVNLDELKDIFIETYGEGEVEAFFAPSRINIIGEHIDYNGGKVLPCAIQLGTYGLVRKSENIELKSLNTKGEIKTDLNNLDYSKEHSWGNYPLGLLKYMKLAGHKIGGFKALIYGNIPNGAGLSSSASIEILIGKIQNKLYNQDKINGVELALIGKEVENKHLNLQSGIMDQFVIAMGKKDHAILLDTSNLEYEYLPMRLGDYSIVIMNTGKRRKLTESKYNERRGECEAALKILQGISKIENLCDLSTEEFEKIKDSIKDEILIKRATHVVYENQRVNDSVKALKKDDFKNLGRLMNESHNSLRDLYEVSGAELDEMVRLARKEQGCLGARMTGAGFSGCAIAFVENKLIDVFIENVGKAYSKKIQFKPEFYISKASDGNLAWEG